MLVIGHRGAAGHRPENTLASVRYALTLGVDAVEIDVQMLDGMLIVLHDDTVDRTTNGRGHFKAMSFSALRALDAGAGERVPLLEEVLALTRGQIGLNIEVKEAGIAAQVIEFVLAATTDLPAWRARILLSSFDVETSATLARLRGTMDFGLLYEEAFEPALARALALGAKSLHMSLDTLDATAIARAHKQGLEVYVYTVNSAEDIARCQSAGVDGVFSDYPDRVIAALRTKS
jgi:glycerophosphoryl diester phosphodiesterase